MKNTAYFKIQENMSPRDASDILSRAVSGGYRDVIVYHEDGANLMGAKYKEKLLSVFRAAYRHKVNIYLSDDCYPFSGTGFGQLCSVKDTRQKIFVRKNREETDSDEILVAQKDDECIVAVFPPENKKYPYGYYPDLTNPKCADMIINYVYFPVLREYSKFVGYELKGFASDMPLYDAQSGNVPYSEAALSHFEKKHNRKPDVFSIVDKTGDYDEYMVSLRSMMEKNFVKLLADFCKQNNCEMIVVGGENSVSSNAGKNMGIVYMSHYPDKSGEFVLLDGFCQALDVSAGGKSPCVRIFDGMKMVKDLDEFFKSRRNSCIVAVESFDRADKNSYILTNMTTCEKSFGFLLEGEWCVYDREKDEWYDFDPRTQYTFHPFSFLCIERKTKSIYTDRLPARVGAVTVGEYERDSGVYFERRANKYAFYLPDKPLSDKTLEFVGEAESINIRMGSMEHTFRSKPYILPLFDFLRDAGCVAEVTGGEIYEIIINKKTDCKKSQEFQ